ncbi:MAG: hypothetical protein QG559_161 [Campylobacterota bacterium]|nr:hypothetical protein [Campylobacterota bacterium]
MKTVTLEIEDSKFEQFMTVLNSLKSDLVKNFEVQKKETHCDLANDPLAQELQKRLQEIDDETMKLTPYSEGIDSMMQRIKLKYASA